MKRIESEFFLQMIGVVVICVLIVATVAFVSIPASLQRHPGEGLAGTCVNTPWHPT